MHNNAENENGVRANAPMIHDHTENENDTCANVPMQMCANIGRKHCMKLCDKNVQDTKDQFKCTKHVCTCQDTSAHSQHRRREQQRQGGQSKWGRITRND